MKRDIQDEELLSQTAFAERVGVSREVVKAWIGAGLPLSGRRVRAEAATAWIEDNVAPRYREGETCAAETTPSLMNSLPGRSR